MGTLSRFFATSMALGLMAAQVAPAYADSGTTLGVGAGTGSAVDVQPFGSCLLLDGKHRRSCIKSVQENLKHERELLKEQRKQNEESSDEHERNNRRTGSGSVEASASLSFGRLVSDIRSELNDFRQTVQRTLNDQRARIAGLSASARSTLYAQIRTLVHNALLDLQVKISAAITAAVGA
ncbi:hypothetical protein A3J91_03845 [Candidatus Peribacteria bacterium RIFOXYC2_FULL_58_10]|nr:MAG: hypothetical protein A3J91_03845 [Candidatus Peribacteria bacterium RIFOXYC2_FULL_58_10]OGJ84405.1 MAG: hypothetical protein A2529_03370 [Candidatus Peribacteria bacterium RIFOXYD2_FULL_58_15]HAS34665.1 hypothetical protein [Candidatus Peribacteria bacterium]